MTLVSWVCETYGGVPDGSAKRLAAMATRIVVEPPAKLPPAPPPLIEILLRGARAASKQAVRDLPSFNMYAHADGCEESKEKEFRPGKHKRS